MFPMSNVLEEVKHWVDWRSYSYKRTIYTIRFYYFYMTTFYVNRKQQICLSSQSELLYTDIFCFLQTRDCCFEKTWT